MGKFEVDSREEGLDDSSNHSLPHLVPLSQEGVVCALEGVEEIRRVGNVVVNHVPRRPRALQYIGEVVLMRQFKVPTDVQKIFADSLAYQSPKL